MGADSVRLAQGIATEKRVITDLTAATQWQLSCQLLYGAVAAESGNRTVLF